MMLFKVPTGPRAWSGWCGLDSFARMPRAKQVFPSRVSCATLCFRRPQVRFYKPSMEWLCLIQPALSSQAPWQLATLLQVGITCRRPSVVGVAMHRLHLSCSTSVMEGRSTAPETHLAWTFSNMKTPGPRRWAGPHPIPSWEARLLPSPREGVEVRSLLQRQMFGKLSIPSHEHRLASHRVFSSARRPARLPRTDFQRIWRP
jgi:hypothetical protein